MWFWSVRWVGYGERICEGVWFGPSPDDPFLQTIPFSRRSLSPDDPFLQTIPFSRRSLSPDDPFLQTIPFSRRSLSPDDPFANLFSGGILAIMATHSDIITFNCKHCGTSIDVSAAFAGRSGPCPACGEKIVAPFSAGGTSEKTANITSNRPVQTSSSWLIPLILGLCFLLIAGVAATMFLKSPPSTELPKPAEYSPPEGKDPSPNSDLDVNPSEFSELKNTIQDADSIVPDDMAGLANQASREVDLGGEPLETGSQTVAAQETSLSAPHPDVSLGAQNPDAAPDTPKFEHPDFPTTGEKSVLAKPRAFLKKYIASRTWKEMLELSRPRPDLETLMKDYYKAHEFKTDALASAAYANTEKVPEDKTKKIFIFNVKTKNQPLPFVVAVEETDNGFQVDWPPMIQFKDRSLQRFYEEVDLDKTDKGKDFYVSLSRANYFGEDIAEVDKKLAFRLRIPARFDQPIYAFVPKFTDYGNELDSTLDWGKRYLVVARLKWSTDATEDAPPYLRLMGIVQYAWRNAPGQSAPESLEKKDQKLIRDS